MAFVLAFWAPSGAPLTSPATAPTVRVRRLDTGALIFTDVAMTEVGDGFYSYELATSETLEYAVRADGDPLGVGQVPAIDRYQSSGVSGVSIQAVEVEIGESLDYAKNRRRIDFLAGPPRQLVLYERDGVTEKARMDLTTTNGAEVIAFFGVQHERGVPV